MHGFFTQRCFDQQVDQQAALHPETFARLSQTEQGRAAIAVLDVLDSTDSAAMPRL